MLVFQHNNWSICRLSRLEPISIIEAGALMLTHDLNQIAVVNSDGVLVGVVGQHNGKTLAKIHIVKLIPQYLSD